MKKTLWLSVPILLLVVVICCHPGAPKTGEQHAARSKVSVVFPVTIDAFDQLKKGVQEAAGEKLDFEFYSAEGDPARFETAIQSALLSKPTYLVTIGTQITNTAFGAKFRNDLPVVIAGAISSPELVEALVSVGLQPKRKSEVAIVSDSPKEDIYALFATALLSFLPHIKKIGILYNPSEINSKGTSGKIVAALKKNGIEVIEGVINSADDIEKVTDRLLLQGAGSVIIPHDKYAVTKAASIVKKCDEKKVPVFSLDDGTVKKDGVSVGISVNYGLIGTLIGQSILEIHSKKASASEMPIVSVDRARIYVNTKKMKTLSIKQPEELKPIIEAVQ